MKIYVVNKELSSAHGTTAVVLQFQGVMVYMRPVEMNRRPLVIASRKWCVIIQGYTKSIPFCCNTAEQNYGEKERLPSASFSFIALIRWWVVDIIFCVKSFVISIEYVPSNILVILKWIANITNKSLSNSFWNICNISCLICDLM